MDPKILKKFSETSKRIITFAQKIANDYKKAIGSEHLLLAILTTPNTIASEILNDYTIGFEQIKLIISNQSESNLPSAGISDEAKIILELSVRKAIETKQSQVSPEHILFALVSVKNSNAYKILSQLNVDPEKIKEIINEILFDLGQVKLTAQKFIQDNFFPAFDIAPFDQAHKDTDRLQKTYQSYLEKFGINLTEQAKNNLLDPVFEREEELFRVLQILNRRTKNNPILVGQAGVGKTAIVEGLAQLIIEKKVPQAILNKQIWQIDLALLVAGTTFRGQFEERIKGLLRDIEKNPNIILFIDEIHTLVGTGNTEGSMDASNILKPALAKGKIRLIGATTDDEYRQYIEKDPALARRMQKVYISEPNLEMTESILQKIKIKYEEVIPEGMDMKREKSFPLEFGALELGSIDLTKGCYLGQEVISRTHYQGQVRKKIFQLKLSKTLENEQDRDILNQDQQKVGEICSWYANQAIALLRLEKLASSTSLYVQGEEAQYKTPKWRE